MRLAIAFAVVASVTAVTACSSSSSTGAGSGTATTAEAPDHGAAIAPAEPPADSERVMFKTLDGVTLVATYVPGPAGSDRAVVFLHQLSSNRGEWAPFVTALRGKYHVLALDMRGHGESTESDHGALDWQQFTDADWDAVTGDLAAATQFLSSKGVALAGTVIVGSSIGSSATLRFAADHPDLAGIVMLSPGLKYHGLETVPAAKRYGKPKLIVYSSDAEDAARGLEQAWKQADDLPQPQPVTMHQVPGKAHGVKMLADDPGLVDAVVEFVDKVLGGS